MSSELKRYSNWRELIDKREFYFGDIYILNDQLVNLPKLDRLKEQRKYHDERWVVIVSNNEENIHPLCPTITVAPLSHRFDLKRPFDLELFKKYDNVKYDCLLMLKLKQPVLKVDLNEKQGEISVDKKDELLALIALYYGLDHANEE